MRRLMLVGLLGLGACGGKDDSGGGSAVDADGDGYAADHDCDDTNADIHRGAVEDCTDGVDNNCDGKIDGDDTAACPA